MISYDQNLVFKETKILPQKTDFRQWQKEINDPSSSMLTVLNSLYATGGTYLSCLLLQIKSEQYNSTYKPLHTILLIINK